MPKIKGNKPSPTLTQKTIRKSTRAAEKTMTDFEKAAKGKITPVTDGLLQMAQDSGTMVDPTLVNDDSVK